MERAFNWFGFALLKRSLPWLLGVSCLLEVFLTSEMLNIPLLAAILSSAKLILFILMGISLLADVVLLRLRLSLGLLLVLLFGIFLLFIVRHSDLLELMRIYL